MGQSLAKVILHNVFSTKDRKESIIEPFQGELYSYIVKTASVTGSYVYEIGGTENHVHIACTLPRTITIGKLLENVKSASSKWLKITDPIFHNFAWQNGDASLSVSQSQLNKVISYVKNQRKHHQKIDYKKEVIELLEKHQVEYDERYLWD